jgi:hypothetical protein
MAVIRPLKLSASGDLIEMSSGEVQLLINEAIRLYGTAPGIELLYDQGPDDGTGFQQKLGAIVENRLQASPLATGNSPWPTPAASTYVATSYDAMLLNMTWRTAFPYKNRAGSSYANQSYPIYYRSDGIVQAASWVDIKDTIIAPALTSLASSAITPAAAAGTYFVSTNTSETDATLVSPNPIAKDTQADIAAFATGSLPETQDQPDNSQTVDYYLHRVNAPAEVPFTVPAVTLDPEHSINTMSRSVYQDMILHLMQYFAVWGTSYNLALRYQTGTLAYFTSIGYNTKGSGITDTYTTSYVQRYEQPNSSTYYSQNVPTGTPSVQTTKYLGVGLS